MRTVNVMKGVCAALAATALSLAGLAAADPPASTACSKASANKLLTVPTCNGPVTGHVAPGTSCVLEYLGIPYAKPPVGELRFAVPQPIDRQKPYTAADFGFDCPLTPSKPVDYPGFTPQAQRIINYFASGTGNPQDEDCLTLNIWSKATPRARSAKKPVIVFLYGGRFTIGSTNSPFYNGKHLADAQDVVVVTLNYRTNIFGFPGAPDSPQNLGLRDQRAAVEWIRDNIAHFGGDSGRIILAGQSSGGVSADYWAYAYPDDPIVAGLILLSGTALSFPFNAPSVPARSWNAVIAAVGCNTTTTLTTLACMRAIPWQTLKSAAAALKPTPSTSPLRAIPPFYPFPDKDTLVFSPAQYHALTTAGRFARAPVLVSTNANEAGYYRVPAFGNGIIPTPEQITAFHRESFTCPAAYAASSRETRGSVPAWVVRYAADWPNTRLYNGSGAYHGVDLHMVFGGAEEVSGLPEEAGQERLKREVVQRAWGAFAEDPWEGLGRVMGWPRWEEGGGSKGGRLVVVGEEGVRFVEFGDGVVGEGGCEGVVMGAEG